MTIMGIVYTEKKDAGSAVIDLCSQMGTADEQETQIGEYLGFTMALSFSAIEKEYLLSLKGNGVYLTHLGQDPSGIIIRINNALDTIPKSLAEAREKLEETREQLEVASIEVKKIFPREEEYQEKQRRLSELDAKLSLDGPMITDKERSCQVAEKQERYLPGKTKAI